VHPGSGNGGSLVHAATGAAAATGASVLTGEGSSARTATVPRGSSDARGGVTGAGTVSNLCDCPDRTCGLHQGLSAVHHKGVCLLKMS